ncbi:cell division protein FtsL [Oceanobacillus bengalensis]|uniref:Cell division protein FtsL n=1 Tax=Oceanobacillus bengalensis TaxID=1435466 RepID=A0A494Z1B4_9BACI|nr:cell division protein FtsL [Oceanobacillus bengalensis]RKQ16312.1 cell division protein FtsL [Oceanobacillus bengalensis]
MSAEHARSWQQLPKQSPKTDQKQHAKVKRKGWITRGEKLVYTIFIAVFIIAGIFLVSYSSTTDTLNRDLQVLEQHVKTQTVINEELVFEQKELSRPERILAVAKEKGLKIQDTEVKQAETFNN